MFAPKPACLLPTMLQMPHNNHVREPSLGLIKGHEEKSLRVGKNRAVEKGKKGAVKLASRAEKGKKKEVRFVLV